MGDQSLSHDMFGRNEMKNYQKFQRGLIRGNALLRFEKHIFLVSHQLR